MPSVTAGSRKRRVDARITATTKRQIDEAVNGLPLVLTTPEAARLLRVGEQTLRNWRVSGEGPKFAKFGRNIRYRLQDVLGWMDRNIYASTTEAFAAEQLEHRGFR